MFIACFFNAFALSGRQVGVHNYPGRCPGLGTSALSGRIAAMSFCSLPFPSAGDRWFRAYCCNELDSIEHNLDEVVDGALIACVGTEGSTVGDDHAAG